MGFVPHMASIEDQRKSARHLCVSSTPLLFTGIFPFLSILYSWISTERFFSVAVFYAWLPLLYSVRRPQQDAGVTRESFLVELQDKDEQTGELQLQGQRYRGGSSSMGSSSDLLSAGFTPTDSDAMAVTVSASSVSHFWASTKE